MTVRILSRIALALLTAFLSTLLLYLAIRMVPGTSWGMDDTTPPERIAEWNRRHHLDRPYLVGYALWARQVLGGDLGRSYTVASGVEVERLVRITLPVSLTLGLLGFGAAVTVSLGLSMLAARRPGGVVDRVASAILYLLNSSPTFWLALLMQYLFAVRLGWLPPMGAGPLGDPPGSGPAAVLARVPYWILPPACLALGSMAFFFRFSRAGILDALASSHVAAARARGLPEPRVVGRHALSAALVNLITMLGLLAPAVIGGSVVVEKIFALPGMARLFFDGVDKRDYPVVMGVGLVMAAVAIAASALADILSTAAEPRLRTGGGVRP